MLKWILIFSLMSCVYGISPESAQKIREKELNVEITLRNLLVVRETFPKVESFWVETTLSRKKKALRPKFLGFLAKAAFSFVRGAAKVAFKVGKRAFLSKPVVSAAMDVVSDVGTSAMNYVKDKLDDWRKPTPAPNSEENYWVCVGYTLDECSYQLLALRSMPTKIVNRVLNDISDPNKSIRSKINLIIRQMIYYKDQHMKKSMNEETLVQKTMEIASKLAALSDSLVVTSIEQKPS